MNGWYLAAGKRRVMRKYVQPLSEGEGNQAAFPLVVGRLLSTLINFFFLPT